jgi:AAA15 family ATPase/GTPase
MTEMWNRLKVSRNASRVIEALKIIDPRVEDIFFEVTDSSERLLNPNSGIRVGLQNHQSLVPLGTLGNGMSHLLHLAVVLVHMSDGFATVDEVETGLHYSLMADLWELVVKTAVESNTQVFATTHSADCIRGLGYFCEDHPEFQDQVSVHRIEPSLGQGIRLGGSEVVQAVEHEIEIR